MHKGEIVKQMRMGDAQAYEEVVGRYVPRLYALAYGIIRDPMEAQDAVQDALTAMVRRLGEFHERATLATWLYRITVNASLDRLRSRRKMGDTISLEEFLPRFTEDGRFTEEVVDWSNAPLERLLSSEAEKRIQQAIASLPEEQRVVLVLKDLEGLSLAEIGKTLDLSLPAVKSRLHRARLALRGVLASYFSDEQSSRPPRPKARRKHKHTCQALVELLCDYLEGDLPPEEKKELDRHMMDCPPCLAFLNTYRKTAQLCRSLRPQDIPEQVRTRLERYLQETSRPSP